ncbi:MarR family winged helix-turn-helix transcriptional regulator [Virgisporangium aurantiacum]|uniref:DNA-binding transcriptional regulator, MarR family n=1 Tax=Virgisporangium aurantiacum TaxID=175570 RepID=A0A8J3Z3L1_9ACTN|nr:hypothetical protein [Virgisporangium aurantiacum]GIJ56684.1 hypothetical protein Vau01_042000 [Virgisporangium aurantiacum]
MSTTTGRPIGHLLRTLDRLIDERFDRTLVGRGVTRRQWQLLNALAGGPATLDTLTAAVAAFLDRSAGETARPHFDPLVAAGIVTGSGDTYALTAAGRATLADLAAEVGTIRTATVAGLPDGEYERTVATLQTMIDNLSPR